MALNLFPEAPFKQTLAGHRFNIPPRAPCLSLRVGSLIHLKPWDLFKSVLTLGANKKKPEEVEVRILIVDIILVCSFVLVSRENLGLASKPAFICDKVEGKGEFECSIVHSETV